MESLCSYKNIFGEPGKGAHSMRLWLGVPSGQETTIRGVAFVDLFATILAAQIINFLFPRNYGFFIYLFALLIVSIILHLLFCVDTTIVRYIKKLFMKS